MDRCAHISWAQDGRHTTSLISRASYGRVVIGENRAPPEASSAASRRAASSCSCRVVHRRYVAVPACDLKMHICLIEIYYTHTHRNCRRPRRPSLGLTLPLTSPTWGQSLRTRAAYSPGTSGRGAPQNVPRPPRRASSRAPPRRVAYPLALVASLLPMLVPWPFRPTVCTSTSAQLSLRPPPRPVHSCT